MVNPKNLISWAVISVCLSALVWMKVSRPTGDQTALFPTRTINIICPYAAGGGTDLFARGLARSAEPLLGHPIIVSNITGGAGAVGHSAGILARPDGYTVTAVTFELVSLPLQDLVPFDHKDFDLLMRINQDPAALAVSADFPGNTIAEFAAWAKNRKSVTIANSGIGSAFHLASAELAEELGIEVQHIPFGGASPALTALLGGHVDAVVVGPGEMRIQHGAGQLKILGVMSEERVALFPEVPTLREAGFDIVMGTWRGLAVPKNTPEPIRKKLTDIFYQALKSPEFISFAENGGLNLDYANAADFRQSIQEQSGQVDLLMKRLHIK